MLLKTLSIVLNKFLLNACRTLTNLIYQRSLQSTAYYFVECKLRALFVMPLAGKFVLRKELDELMLFFQMLVDE
jgi:hypothetical protein